MSHASRPLLALLAATVLVFMLWIVALKPHSSGSAGTGGSKGQAAYQSDINAAHQAVNASNGAGAADGGQLSTSSSRTQTAQGSTPSSKPAPSKAPRVKVSAAAPPTEIVQQAIEAHKVLALLFYNPNGPDDQLVRQELAAVPTYGGAVVKVTIPIDQLSQYTNLLSQVPITTTPTLVLINSSQQASTIVGFADSLEIDQRVTDALVAARS